MKKIAVALTLAMAFCFVLASAAQAGPDDPVTVGWAQKNLKNSRKAAKIPTWQITQDGTSKSVEWVNATNPRFAIYDTDGNNTEDPATWEWDVVLDKETGLCWERKPTNGPVLMDWYSAVAHCMHQSNGNRKGWRLPTIQELGSLVDRLNQDPALPNGHPFIDVYSDVMYWSSTTHSQYSDLAWGQLFLTGSSSVGGKEPPPGTGFYTWCCRGGQGYDGM